MAPAEIPRAREAGLFSGCQTTGVTGAAESVRRQLVQHPGILDVAVVLGVLTLSVPPLVDGSDCGCHPTPVWGFFLVGLQGAALLGRRRLPFLTSLVVGILTAIYGVSSLPDPAVPFAGLVATYSAAAYATRRLALVTAACTAVGIAIALLADRGHATVQDWSI